jgi:hypothetical protein
VGRRTLRLCGQGRCYTLYGVAAPPMQLAQRRNKLLRKTVATL